MNGEMLYRSHIYTWIIRMPGRSERMKIRVVAKDEEEAKRKATARMDANKDDEFLNPKLKEWRAAFDEQINGSPVMIMKGDYDVFITFVTPDQQ